MSGCWVRKLLVVAVIVCRCNAEAPGVNVVSCVPIEDCPYIYNITTSSSNANEVFQLLRKSHCGFNGTHPKVWCKEIQQQKSCVTIDGRNGTCQPKEKCNEEDEPEQTTCNESRHICCPKNRITRNSSLPLPGMCGFDPFFKKIVGGMEAELDEFPWMAILQYRAGQTVKQACSASLITKHFLVTAAHCVDPEAVEAMGYSKLESAVLGEYNTDTEEDCIEYDEGYRECSDRPKVVPVKSTFLHPEWTWPGIDNDIALLKMATPVDFTYYIKPVCLPLEGWTPNATESLLIAGWGKSEKERRSAIKMKAVVHHTNCTHLRATSTTQICADGKGSDTCTGDSGGPLMFGKQVGINFVLFLGGIVSYGTSRCGSSYSVYTFVPEYIDWIKSVIQNT